METFDIIDSSLIFENKRIQDFFYKNSQSFTHQYPEFSCFYYAKRKINFFFLQENSTDICGALLSTRFLNAEILFGPVGGTNEQKASLINKIIFYLHKKKYGNLKITLPYNQDVSTFWDAYKPIKGEKIITDKSWQTWMLNLDKNFNEIYTNFSLNHKRNIKKAINLGLSVKEINTENDIEKLAIIYDELYKHRQIKAIWASSKIAFRNWFIELKKYDKLLWYGVYDNQNELLGGIMLSKQGESLFYQLGASNPNFRKLPLLHLVFAKAIEQACNNNIKYFDFGGYDKFADETKQTYSINRFKEGFGGYELNPHGSFNVKLNIPAYYLTLTIQRMITVFSQIKILIKRK